MTVRMCESCRCWIPEADLTDEWGFWGCVDEYACRRRSQDNVALEPPGSIDSYECPVE